MPRFVILRHELPAGSARPSHYDLMLEQGAVLRTWACEKLPGLDWEGEAPAEPARREPRPSQEMRPPKEIATQLPDHRLAYLDYEGPISGNRGSVTRIDAGEYEPLVDSPEQFRVKIVGQQLQGILTLTCENADAQRWSVVLSPE